MFNEPVISCLLTQTLTPYYMRHIVPSHTCIQTHTKTWMLIKLDVLTFVSLLERCPHFRGWYVQASMELGPEDVSLLKRCPHFRGWYVQASMELGPEDVSLLERCPHFRGYMQSCT